MVSKNFFEFFFSIIKGMNYEEKEEKKKIAGKNDIV